MGMCDFRLGEYNAARESFQKAVELDEQKADYAASLAELLRDRLNVPNEGRAVLDRLIDKAPASTEARLARGRWLLA